MSSSHPPSASLRFGEFTADLEARELFRNDSRVKLQGQPFEILAVLLEHPGRVVTREELHRRLWPSDTFVDFEHGLNAAVNRLREAFGDSAEEPHFIETIHRRGYKFVAPLDGVTQPTVQAAVSTDARGRYWRIPLGLGGVAILAVAGFFFWLWAGHTPKVTAWTQLSFTRQVSGQLVTDGRRIYFTASKNSGKPAYVSIAGGDQALMTLPLGSTILRSISPDGSMLLVLETETGERPDEGTLWLVPATGGGPRRLGDTGGHDGTWSPDGQHIVYTFGQTLYLADKDGSNSRELITTPGKVDWIRWSPDSTRMRFTLFDPKTGQKSLWECRADGTGLHRLRLSGQIQMQECCGEWTADGRYFLFTTIRENRTDVWAIREQGLLGLFHKPIQLTGGPMDAFSPIAGPTGKKLFVIGSRLSAELFKYDVKTGKIIPYLAGISTAEAATSPDGQRITYSEVRGRESILWRSKPDGKERVQLTTPPVEAGWQMWSPDGKEIAFFAKRPDGPWSIYLVAANGSIPRALSPKDHSYVDPEWSPDGHSLMFGRSPENWWLEVSTTKTISLLNLDKNQITTLPGSEGLFSPRWSPDGRYVVAMALSYRKLLLFDFATQTWSELASSTDDSPRIFDTPRWSPDSEHVYFNDWARKVVMRVGRRDHKLEDVFDLKTADPNASYCRLHGVASDGTLLVGCWFEGGDIYALDADLP